MMSGSKKKIFISYRVRDTQAATGRLVDALKQHFDDDQIFMDIDKIEPGLDFTEVISNSLDNCDVLLAIIGPDWMALNKDKNTYRINEDNDWVRIEIATALKRNIRVVPVLLEGGVMPEEDLLTDDLKPLLRRQSYEISNKRWKYDSDELIAFLKKILGHVAKPLSQQISTPKPLAPPKKNKSGQYLLFACLGLFLLIVISLLLGNEDVKPEIVGPGSVDTASIVNRDHNLPKTNKDIAGNWYDQNGKGTYQFTQTGEQISLVIIGSNGVQSGTGSGFINGSVITLQVSLVFNNAVIPCTMNLTLSSEENVLEGEYKIENNGSKYTEPIRLEKL